jgi:hypothetical protein
LRNVINNVWRTWNQLQTLNCVMNRSKTKTKNHFNLDWTWALHFILLNFLIDVGRLKYLWNQVSCTSPLVVVNANKWACTKSDSSPDFWKPVAVGLFFFAYFQPSASALRKVITLRHSMAAANKSEKGTGALASRTRRQGENKWEHRRCDKKTKNDFGARRVCCMCVGNGEGLLSRCGDVSEPHVRAEKGRSLVGGAAWASPLSALLAPGLARSLSARERRMEIAFRLRFQFQ